MLYIYKLNALSAAEQEAFLTAVDRCGETICLIEDNDLSRTVTEVLETLTPMEMRDFKPFAQEAGDPFLLMDVDDLALDPILAAMRGHKINIGHKCMVTDKNREWTIQKLIGDVGEEHALMTALMKLKKMVEEAADIKEEGVNPLLWMAYSQKKLQAEDLLAHIGKVEIPGEAVEATMAQLEQAIQMVRGGGMA